MEREFNHPVAPCYSVVLQGSQEQTNREGILLFYNEHTNYPIVSMRLRNTIRVRPKRLFTD